MNKLPSEFLKVAREPWPHQWQELDISATQTERALLWQMGTGKMATGILWLRVKYSYAGAIVPTLIISPVATLQPWKEEFAKVSPEHVSSKVVVAYGEGKKQMSSAKKAELIAKGDIVIINYESLTIPAVLKALQARGFKAIICDESQRIKGYKSKRLANLLTFSDKATYRMIMSGTPILNSYFDIWAQWRFLDAGKTFGTNFFSHFRNKYFYDKNAGMPPGRYFPDWVPQKGLGEEIARLIALKASRKLKSECLNLPERVFVTRDIELSPEQRKHYDAMEEDLVTYMRDDACAASNALVKIARLLQIVSGYVKLDEHGAVSFTDNPRLDDLEEVMLEVTPQAKLIVWASFQESYDSITALFHKHKVNFAELTGRTKDRNKEIAKFRDDPTCRIMLSNAKAGGVGVGMQQGSYSYYYGYTHSLEEWLQSLDRNHRGGSEIHDKITVLIARAKGTIQEDVLEALRGKEDMANKVLDGVQIEEAFAKELFERIRSKYAQGQKAISSATH